MKNVVSIAYLHEVYSYCPNTGKIVYRVDRGPRRAGEEAGSIDEYGYRRLHLGGLTYAAARVAYAMYHGEWPENEVDHWDRCRANNRISNLRDVTPVVNSGNQGRPKNNTSGYTGVDFNQGKWRARITREGKSKLIGLFDSALEAHSARQHYKEANP